MIDLGVLNTETCDICGSPFAEDICSQCWQTICGDCVKYKKTCQSGTIVLVCENYYVEGEYE